MADDKKKKANQIKFAKTDPNAIIPTRAHKSDAGWDLYTPKRIGIHKGRAVTICLNIACEIPPGSVMLIQGRSGLAKNNRITTIGNVIDSGYRGAIHVNLVNLGPESVIVKAGDRIAQGVVLQLVQSDADTVELDELSESDRGSKGFGSSGK